jgi:hypothetical protein
MFWFALLLVLLLALQVGHLFASTLSYASHLTGEPSVRFCRNVSRGLKALRGRRLRCDSVESDGGSSRVTTRAHPGAALVFLLVGVIASPRALASQTDTARPGFASVHVYDAPELLRETHSSMATKPGAGAADDAATAFRDDTSHIFRDARGHLPADTPANRQLIKSAIDPANVRSTTRLPDGSTLTKYFKTLPDGTQVWAEVRNGTTITNGGLNATPR